MASGEVTGSGRRLAGLIALDDAARAERLSTALAETGDLLPIVAGGSDSDDRADVAIVDDNNLEAGAGDLAIPLVILSQRAGPERMADSVFAVLPATAD